MSTHLTHRHKKVISHSIILVGLVFLVSLAGSSATFAQDEAAFVRLIRVFDADSTGDLNPAGLAFSPGANHFLVLEADGSTQLPSRGSDIIMIAPVEDRVGSVGIAVVVPDPINMVFDDQGNRLLLLDSASNELVEIDVGADETLDPTSLRRHDAQRFGLINPQGMTVDPVSGDLFILDNTGPRLVRVAPGADQGFDTAVIAALNLAPTGLADVRGLALDPTTGHLHLVSPTEQKLYELTQTGQVVTRRDLSEFALGDPQGMVFAPSGDQTDDPLEMSLYLADSRATGGQQGPGRIIELSFAEPFQPIRVAASFTSSLIQTTNTWEWSPPSPDPAGITYLSDQNKLMVSDSEVNETPIYQDVNLFTTELSGTVHVTGTTLAASNSNEPTGTAYNANNGDLFISDDVKKDIYIFKAESDGVYGTGDDIVTSFDTLIFGSGDPEGVAFDSSGQGTLYIADGINREVYIVTPGPNGLFDGVDDDVTNFDTSRLGLENPEGIAFNTDTGHLYLVGSAISTVFEVTTGGNLVQTIDISAANPVNPGGLAYAPSSQIPSEMNIYITDRRIDNNADPTENDGVMYEMTLPPPPSGPVPPVAEDDNANTTDDTPVTIDVTPNDTDLNGNLDPASANTTCANGSSGCADPVNGSVDNNGDGTFTYTSDPGYAGPDSFVYEICDTDLLCDTATVTIAVFGQQTLYVSSSTGGVAGGVVFRDEDILAYDLSTSTWSMYIDGSDVGLDTFGLDIDAFHINADGSILLSLNNEGTIPDVGLIDDSDIVRFVPTSTGNTTAGTYEWYFDGSAVGLEDNGEDIDAIGLAPDGRLTISTTEIYTVTGVSGSDEDLLRFTATSLGETTSGTWDLYFDGSDVGLNTTSAEDTIGAWIDDNGDIYLTTRGDFSVTGVTGDAADIFTCVPGSTGVNTSCTFRPSWDGSASGFAGEIVNGIAFDPSIVTVPVPDVVGLPQANAEATIVAASLTVGTVSTAHSDTVPAGNVISQDPAANIPVLPGTAVDLVVSLGPALVTVPDVVGLPQADAEAAIVAAGLTVGTVTTAYSNSVPAGNVISQDPAANVDVLPGTAVDLVVSLGPAPIFLPLIFR